MMEAPQELTGLRQMSRATLRELWRRNYGQPPPCALSREFLLLELAWRQQAHEQGGLSVRAQRRLKALQTKSALHASLAGRPARLRYQPGTVLTKAWQGRRYQVIVQEQGFLYDGQRYQSLSEIARQITGTRWNGPAFFGLRALSTRQTKDASSA